MVIARHPFRSVSSSTGSVEKYDSTTAEQSRPSVFAVEPQVERLAELVGCWLVSHSAGEQEMRHRMDGSKLKKRVMLGCLRGFVVRLWVYQLSVLVSNDPGV